MEIIHQALKLAKRVKTSLQFVKRTFEIKQAGCCWNKTVDKLLSEFNLTRSMIDSSYYSKSNLRVNRKFI